MSNVNNRQAFLDDVSAVTGNGFWQNNVIARNLTLFDFWYMTVACEVQPPQPDRICSTVTWPNLTGDAAFAEVFILVHSTACATVPLATGLRRAPRAFAPWCMNWVTPPLACPTNIVAMQTN
jgi:hypothetical protein